MRKIIYFFILFFTVFPIMANQISLLLKNAPTAEVLAYLAEETEKNIIISDEIKETKNLRMEKSDFDRILNAIVKTNQLSLKKENEVYYISHKNAEKLVENKISIQSNVDLTPKPPKLITKTFKLHYSKASEVIDTLTKGQGNLLSENGYIHFDDRSNSIIVKDSPASIKNFTQLLKIIDKPTEQIAIEARIVTISSEHLQQLGVRWGLFSPSESHHKFAGSLEGNGLTTNNLNVNFPVNPSASVALQIASINSRVLDLELTALERENNIEIIASPRLLTTDKKVASIKQGTEIPYAIYSKKEEISDIEFREAVLGLEVTPHISSENQILLDLSISQNSPNSQTTNNAMVTIDKQEIKTQVFAKHGETIVLGGVFQHLISKGEDKVPLLGSIPVIKTLFSQNHEKISKRELIIFVTPYIVKSGKIQGKSK
ncbi:MULTISPECIES: type IV pilus secretin PilQ [Glaesserella]|uniref:Type IV pilus secretin PilQ n=1 Tax=Glaesserella australis TaxID=2094024 RepID=A0A328C3V1_9PAST|nr:MULTISPECIES: type IV pilus secretin PilQ [Glaesserella]AUI66182.1 type IV pilus secretin PilQ [Glaesserella sp. 15-184]RAL19204.1 type IV pilus secretin PilQ [Glaesserella australis]